jgi:predicted aconitase
MRSKEPKTPESDVSKFSRIVAVSSANISAAVYKADAQLLFISVYAS